MAGGQASGGAGAAVVLVILEPGAQADLATGGELHEDGDVLLNSALALVDGADDSGLNGGVHLYAVDPAEAPGVLLQCDISIPEVPCVCIWGARSQSMKTT